MGPDQKRRGLLSFAQIALVVFLAACGGDSLDSADSTIAGVFWLSGPVGGADVSAYIVQDSGTRLPDPVGHATTNEDGSFTLASDAYGTLLLEARGGLARELATGETVTLDDTVVIRGVQFDLEPDEIRTDAVLTAVTEISVALGERRFEKGRTSAEAVVCDGTNDTTCDPSAPFPTTHSAAMAEAYALIGAHLGGDTIDPSRTMPADVTDPALAGTSLTAEVRYGAALAGLSQLAAAIGEASEPPLSVQEVNTWTVTRLLAADVGSEEARLDGRGGLGATAPITIGACPPPEDCEGGEPDACRTRCDYSVNTTRSEWAQAILAFLSSDVNATTLNVNDTLTGFLDPMAQDDEPRLYGLDAADSVRPVYDQTPPMIQFEVTPPADYFGGTISVKATAHDELSSSFIHFTGPSQLVIDPDTEPSIARATLNTVAAGIVDGSLTIEAEAADLSGNAAVASITVTIDNTAPSVVWEPGAFYIDPQTGHRWTAQSGPVITGSVTDGNPGTLVAVRVNGVDCDCAALVTDTTWSANLPDILAAVPATNTIEVRATDAAGNVAVVTQTVLYDPDPPAVEPQTTSVYDEQADVITFPSHASPHHVHAAPTDHPVTQLGNATTCTGNSAPQLYKHVYTLDPTLPPGITENSPNPLAWKFRLTDSGGVGIDPATAEYRVIKPNGTSTAWAGAGTAAPVTGGYEYTFKLYRTVIAELGTTQGAFKVELRGKDLLGRASVLSRCWTHHPLAAPVKVGDVALAASTDGNLDALAALTLDGNDAQIVELLNGTSLGRSVMKVPVQNGTPEPVYITLDPTAPTDPKYETDWVFTNALVSTQTTGQNCGNEPCPTPALVTTAFSNGLLVPMTPNTNLNLVPRLFDMSGTTPQSVAPCNGCAPNQFRLEARTSPTSEKSYMIVVATKSLPDLRPGGSPTYQAGTLTWDSGSKMISGKLGASSTGCINPISHPNGTHSCSRNGTYRSYRALTKARVTFADHMKVVGATAASVTLTPLTPFNLSELATDGTFNWQTSETGLPSCYPAPSGTCPPTP